MIRLLEFKNEQKISHINYLDTVTMEMAAKQLADGYRNELSERNNNTIYLENVETAVSDYNYKPEWFVGPGYYKDEECILLDSTTFLYDIYEDNKHWKLIEI